MQKVVASQNCITVDDKMLMFNFNYKNFETFSLEWSNKNKVLKVWKPSELSNEIAFKGTENEYNEYVQPLVDLYNQRLQEDQHDQVLQNTLLLEKYDTTMQIYKERINLALINDDLELASSLKSEMNNYDPKINTQSIEQLQHYCKKCGHELNEMNICTNENCKRKELQENIIQAINIQAINIQTINIQTINQE